MIPTLPLRIRDRLASTILAALADGKAREELAVLAHGDMARWLTPDEHVYADMLAERAQAAMTALTGAPAATVTTLETALAAAARLLDAHLYFEVHELLEPFWQRAAGDDREALQGLIQVAVGYQHLANGNEIGAHALLADGAAKLHGRQLAEIELDGFARAVAESIGQLSAWDWRNVPRLPRRGGV